MSIHSRSLKFQNHLRYSLGTMLRLLDKWFGQTTANNYSLTKFRTYLHYLWSTSKSPDLHHGKVGSSTIAKSLRAHQSINRYLIYQSLVLNTCASHYKRLQAKSTDNFFLFSCIRLRLMFGRENTWRIVYERTMTKSGKSLRS